MSGARNLVCVAFLLALLGSAQADASEQQRPRLALEGVRVSATWREGWLTGSVSFRGTVGEPAALVATLRRIGGGALPRRRDFRVRRAGRFRRKLELPARPLPGVYRLQISGSSDAGALPTVARTVRVPAPTEGVVDRAIASARAGGPPARVLVGPRYRLFARFRFLVRPRAQRVLVTWRAPSYDVFASTTKPYTRTIYSSVRSSEGPLQRGIWYCVLTVGDRVAKRVTIRIT